MNFHKYIDKYKITKDSIFLLLCIFIVSCSDNPEETKAVANKPITLEQFDSLHRDNSKFLKGQDLKAYILTAQTISTNKNLDTPFGTLSYDKIIAYDFEGSEEPYPSVLDKNLKFVPVILKQQALTQKQADKILSALTKKSTYGEATAACFNPHLALLFFKDDKFKNAINICLDCNYLISDVEIPAETQLKINKGKKNEYAITGFTKTGKKAIIDLCKELNFYYGEIGSR